MGIQTSYLVVIFFILTQCLTEERMMKLESEIEKGKRKRNRNKRNNEEGTCVWFMLIKFMLYCCEIEI